MAGISYPSIPNFFDPEAVMQATARGYQDGQNWKDEQAAPQTFADALRRLAGPQATPQTLAALGQQVAATPAVQRAPLDPPTDPATARVDQAFAAQGQPSVGAMRQYIAQAAAKRGIDPATAIRVAESEGLGKGIWQSNVAKGGKREPSYGPFQMLVGGGDTGFPTGLGNAFQEQTGLDPSDPANWQKTVDYALDTAGKSGWGQWYGAKNAGIAPMQGINGPGPSESAPVQVADASGGMPPQAPQQASDGIDPDALKALFANRITRPLAIEYAKAKMGALADASDPQKQIELQIAQAKLAALRDPRSKGKFGNSVVWGQDDQGKWVAMQPSSAGGLELAPTPNGVTLSPPGMSNLNLGTQYGMRDRNGQVVNTVPIDNAGKASDTSFGKGQGEARSTLASMQSQLPGLETVVKELDGIANRATYTTAGQVLDVGRKELGLAPRDAAIARTEYISKVSNQILPLLRETFGAQFTAREGDTLMATMGDPDKTPAEKQAVLRSFIEQKKRNIEALAAQTGQTPAAGGGNDDPLGIR